MNTFTFIGQFYTQFVFDKSGPRWANISLQAAEPKPGSTVSYVHPWFRVPPDLWEVIENVKIPFTNKMTISVSGHLGMVVPRDNSGTYEPMPIVESLHVLAPSNWAAKFEAYLSNYDLKVARAAQQLAGLEQQVARYGAEVTTLRPQVRVLTAEKERLELQIKNAIQGKEAAEAALAYERLINGVVSGT